jgi:polysaccharide pyruvyl transferase WcaK-like protein
VNLTLFDTAAATDNLGDEIIMQAFEHEMRNVFPDAYIFRVATHEYMTNASRRLIRDSAFAFVCGTNLLSPHMIRPKWKLRPWDGLLLNNAILCGVGWCGYRRPADAYTRWLLNQILKNGAIHSVRDNYTMSRIGKLHHKIVNTACPTMWSLDKRHCEAIPRQKADVVVATLNSWHPDPQGDRRWLETLSQHYRQVHFWPQTSEDIHYFASLGVGKIKRIPPSVSAYNDFLDNESTDYVGLRLHGGIRAMQKYKRSLIVGLDNRSTELSRDTGLQVVPRNDIHQLTAWIWGHAPTRIEIPGAAIERWKEQFTSPNPKRASDQKATAPMSASRALMLSPEGS